FMSSLHHYHSAFFVPAASLRTKSDSRTISDATLSPVPHDAASDLAIRQFDAGNRGGARDRFSGSRVGRGSAVAGCRSHGIADGGGSGRAGGRLRIGERRSAAEGCQPASPAAEGALGRGSDR